MRDWCSECQFANYGGSQEPCYNCVTAYNKKPSEFTPATDEVRGVGKWIPFTTRPMTEEERKQYSEQYGYDIEYEEAVIYTSELPDDLQEILVCNKWGHVWIDTFLNDPDYGVSLEENGDMDGVIGWMPKPKPMEASEDD